MVRRLWFSSPPLTATGLLMLVALAGTVIGLVIDPRMVTGAPVWLKPAKFSVSIAIYTLTLAWIFSLIPEWPRVRRVVGWTTAVTLLLEIVLIGLQAFRGTTSHFNIGTIFDAVVFGMMGTAIVVQTLATVAVAVALWRHRFADPAMGWALRLGITITIIGAMTGGLMTQPTTQQRDLARAGQRVTVAGAHTVGAPDGGPGLPGTGWSTEHGDLRVAALLRFARGTGIAALRLRAGARQGARCGPRALDDHRRCQLHRALRHPPVAGAARSVDTRARHAHSYSRCRVGPRHRGRPGARRASRVAGAHAGHYLRFT